jgi:hypothetical protein
MTADGQEQDKLADKLVEVAGSAEDPIRTMAEVSAKIGAEPRQTQRGTQGVPASGWRRIAR